MDPLSITASIIAVLQLSAKVLGYLSDVKDASKDCARCAIEAANARSLLMNLRFRLEDGSPDAPWYTAVRTLGVENGPLDQFKQALEELQNGMIDKGRLHQAGRALVWKLKKEEIVSLLARIERLKALVGIALEMDHLSKLSKAIKEDTNVLRTHVSATKSRVDSIWQDQLDEKHKKLTEWISPTNYPAQQADIIARRQEGTGQWFIDAPEFAKWINQPNGTIFCPGIPGAGKTMVAAIAIDHLLKSVQSNSVGVAYIYCNYKAQEEQNASSMLAAIVKQLLQSRSSVAEPVARLHKEHSRKGTKPSLEEISDTLREIIANYSAVYFVIDALDECKDSDGSRRQLIAKLQGLQAGQDVRLMATSRFIPEIEGKFKQAEKLEIRASDEDVRQYVAGQMYRLPKCIQRDSALRHLVEERIPERVDGMFLLARLHVDSLLDKTTAKKVKTALSNLSKGSAALSDAYKDALQRIESQLDGQYELAKKVLSWITHAKRPLTTAELCCALAVEPEETELDPDNIPDPEDLLSICAGLVIIDQESAVVRLVHYTTQEYFERIIHTWNPGALLEITSTCLTYLSFNTFQTGESPSDEEFEKRLQENEFLDYAAKHWGEHALMVQHESCELIYSFLRKTELVSCATQVLLASRVKRENYSQKYPKPSTGLRLATRFGLSNVVQKALSDEEQQGEAVLEQKDDQGQTLLHLAVQSGHCGTTQLLLQKGAQVNGTLDWLYLLFTASNYDYEAIVELLLKKGANENLESKVYGPAFQVAAANGHKSIVELLLNYGADANLISKYSGSAILEAYIEGHNTIVELLLEKGADVNTNTKWGPGTILTAAAARGDENFVKLLLEKGADVNKQSNIYGTALQAAAANGHESTVKLLLENGAEVNIKSGSNRTALLAALNKGHGSIAELLLGKGAQVNLQGEHNEIYSMELVAASAGGHDVVVKILLEKGVGENPRSAACRDALTAALRGRHKMVAMILRNAGIL